MTDRHLSTHGHDCLSEKPVASIKTLARYEPDTVYIGTGEYVAECVRADDGDYYLAADADAAIEALLEERDRLAAENARLREAAKSARDALAVAIKAAWEGSTDADVAEHVVIKKLDAAIDAALAKENSDARAALAKAEGR